MTFLRGTCRLLTTTLFVAFTTMSASWATSHDEGDDPKTAQGGALGILPGIGDDETKSPDPKPDKPRGALGAISGVGGADQETTVDDPTPDAPTGDGGILGSIGNQGSKSELEADGTISPEEVEGATTALPELRITSAHLTALLEDIQKTEDLQAHVQRVARLRNTTFTSIEQADAALRHARKITSEVLGWTEDGALDGYLSGQSGGGRDVWRGNLYGVAIRDLNRILAFRSAGGDEFDARIFGGSAPVGADPNLWADAVEQVLADRARIALASDIFDRETARQTRSMKQAREGFRRQIQENRRQLINRFNELKAMEPHWRTAGLHAFRIRISDAFVALTAAKLWVLTTEAQAERRILEVCRACLEAKLPNATKAVEARISEVLVQHRQLITKGETTQWEGLRGGPEGVSILYLTTWQFANGLESRRKQIRDRWRWAFQEKVFDITDAQIDQGLDPDSPQAIVARADEVNRLRAEFKAKERDALATLGDGDDEEVMGAILTDLQASREHVRGGMGAKISGTFSAVEKFEPFEIDAAEREALEAALGPLSQPSELGESED